jgi:large subunit ribosomal protein L44
MGHVQKRLVTGAAKIASVSTAHLPRFPPKEALFVKRDIPKAPFSPETWATLQPPPSSALSAFAHRIGLSSVLSTPDVVLQAVTHPSFLPIHRQQVPHESSPATNGHLSALGNALMGLFASEYLHSAYPHLPTRVLKAAVTAHVGPQTCASVAQEMGATPLLRWHRLVRVYHSRFSPANHHSSAKNAYEARRPSF